MKVYPAIDVKNGHCVKLRQGQFHDSEIYCQTPAKVAKTFEQQGANGIHIIDLDGVLTGHGVNDGILRDIITAVSIPIQMGGGIRTIKDIENALLLGVERVIIGTKAVDNSAFVKDAISTFGADHVIVAVDVLNGMVAVDGWDRVTTYNPIAFGMKMKKIGVKTIVYKDILGGKSQQGPNIENIKELVETTGLNVMVSGGINSLKDLEVLSSINVEAAIIGRALYENKIELKKALELFENCKPVK